MRRWGSTHFLASSVPLAKLTGGKLWGDGIYAGELKNFHMKERRDCHGPK